MSSPRPPFAAMTLGCVGALAGTLVVQRTGGPWHGPPTRTRRQCVQSALIALDEAGLNGTPPTVRELARSSGLPPWSMTPRRALKSSPTRIIV